MKKIFFLLILLFNGCSNKLYTKNSDTYNEKQFQTWIKDFKKQAHIKHNISKSTLDISFKNIKYNKKAFSSDNHQPEFSKTFAGYINNVLSKERISTGKFMLKNYKTLLKNVYTKYKIPPEIIVSFWGLETFYGKIMGNYNIIESLASLSFNSRRYKFFESELITALYILDKKYIKLSDLYGSWAGAFGNFQFMPTTYKAYAIDGNNDGYKNITKDIVDAMHSAANYLNKMGWDKNYPWGIRVVVLNDNEKIWKFINSNKKETVKFFKNNGVIMPKNNKYLRGNKLNALVKLIAPQGSNGPTFMVYKNFDYIMNWNASINYALGVGLLSDSISSSLKFTIPSTIKSDILLDSTKIKTIQKLLKEQGFYPATPTGFYGNLTTQSIKQYQNYLKTKLKRFRYKSGKLIIEDGYPSADLYNELVNIK